METKNLVINYPDVFSREETAEQAAILQQAYDTFFGLFGSTAPYGGAKIAFKFDPQLKGGAYSGNPVTMCGACPNLFSRPLSPPDSGFIHELVHDFTNTGKTPAARYIAINPSMSEAFANFFTYYFVHEVLKYSPESIEGMEAVRTIELGVLANYEKGSIDPYSQAWGPDEPPQFYFTGMLFRLTERCGWESWPRYFEIAGKSGRPGLDDTQIDMFADMGDARARQAFAEFVDDLGQACHEDMRPAFRAWRFDIP